MRVIFLTIIAAASLFTSHAAITLNLSHTSLPQDTNAVLVHTISGLTSGEKVTVERIADLNNNGAADPAEPSLRTFSVTDGARSMIGGVVNGNVPGDDDAVANGTIRVDLNFPGVDVILGRLPGRYIIRVTGPSGTDARPFEIVGRSLPQRFTGVVRNGSTGAPAPNALVVALVGDGIPVGSVRADANGVYNYVAAAGDYALLPFADGQVGAFTPVTLGSGETKTENLSMQPATIRVSGRVFDSTTQAGVASVFVIGENESGEITGALSDSSGNYAFNILPGDWAIHTLADFAAQTGHIQGEDEIVTAVSAPITADLALIPANALAYGRITDSSGAPIPGLVMEAYGVNPALSSTFEFESAGRTTANGDYWIGLAGGSNSRWQYGVGENPNATYLSVRFNVTAAIGQTFLSNFPVTQPTAQITGFVRNAANQPLANVGLHASATIDNVDYSINASTDGTGSYSFPAINGSWFISINCDDLQRMNYSCSSGASITVTNNNPAHNFVVSTFVSTATLSGRVLDPADAGLSGIQLIAFSANSGNFRSGDSGPDGSFSIPVNAGTWYLQVSGNPPAGFLAPSLQFSITDGNNINNIQLRLINADVTLSGTVKNSSGTALSEIRLYINGIVNSTNYNIPQVTTTESGTFSVQVARGSWNINVDCEQVTSLGYICPFGNSIDTTAGNVDQNIVVSSPVTPANLLAPRVVNSGGSVRFEFTISGSPATYDIQGTSSVPFTTGNWRTMDTRTIPSGQTSLVVQIDPQENRFFRVVARQ
jgi:hypothetical protein